MPFNAHRVFAGSNNVDGYLDALTLDSKLEESLRSARDQIRKAVKEGLADWSTVVRRQDLFDSALTASEVPPLRPKFRMQGSFTYRTCNVPAQIPPQEVDLDDGLFLPISFLIQNGGSRPSVASKGFFATVERILAPLCKRNQWVLITDKPSCVRIRVSDKAHIDLALYAISDQDFETLTQTAVALMAQDARQRVQLFDQLRDSLEFPEDVYGRLRNDQIMLAHRDDGWKPSDPRLLEEWFRDALKTHGEQLRRICRYLKGWRDYQWSACRLASIAIMSAVITAYEEALTDVPDNRDDKALLLVAEKLPGLLSNAILNPVVAGQRLDEGWTTGQRTEFVAKANDLLRNIRRAIIEVDEAGAAIAALAAAFGDRIPDDIRLVSSDEDEPAPERKAAALAAPTLIIPSGAEAARRAELAARELESRGPQSKPWLDKSK